MDILGRIPGELGAYPSSTAEVQTVTPHADSASGSFTLVTDYGETISIVFNSGNTATSAANLQGALAAQVGPGNVSVAWSVDHFVVTFAAALGNMSQMQVGDNSLVDGVAAPVADPVVATTTPGQMGIAYDLSPILTVVSTTADLLIETSDAVYQGAADGVISLGAQIERSNLLTPPTRLRIGSPYPIDYTLLDREAVITLNMEIDDPALYRKVYYAGGSWNPEPWVGGFKIKATSAERPFTIGATPTPFSLEVLANSLHFNTMLIVNEPQKVVEATLTASLLKSADNDEEALEFKVVTDQAPAFS
jgi:hypothetical protein